MAPLDVDSNTIAYWLLAFVILVIVAEELLRRFGPKLKRKEQRSNG
jgi:hypothetical protein